MSESAMNEAQVRIERERSLLFSLMDNIPDSVYFKDADSRYTLINRALAMRFGLQDPQEAIGRSDFNFFTAEHASEAFEDERRVMLARRPVVGKEEKETWLDGRETWVSTTKLPLFGADGEIVGTCGISRDITERREARQKLAESERRYRQLLSTVPSYTYTVMLEAGRPVGTGHSAGSVAVTGYMPEDYVEQPDLWIQMVHPDDRGKVLEHVHDVLGGRAAKPIEHRILHKGGSVRWVRNTVVPHYDTQGRLTLYDGLIEDITRRKEAELALEEERRQLEIRIEERTRELKGAVDRLQEVDRARAEFVSNVSHELKNPLASMGYAIDNLLRGFAGTLSDKTREYVELLQADCRRLGATIENILDLGRIDAKAAVLHTRTTDLGVLVRRAIRYTEYLAGEKKQMLAVQPGESPLFVECDAERIERALVNLIRNAVKFTPEGGHISVALARRGSDGRSEAVISITDDGIGIAAEHLPRLTERYFRVYGHVEGTGLGLSICREIMEQHGGRIEFDSPPSGHERGTEVRLCLPLPPRPAGA